MQERERLSIEIFPILCEPSAPPEPRECSFHDPSPWQDDKAFSLIRALDDFDIHLCHYFLHGAAKHRALIATIGVEFQQERNMPNIVAMTSAPPSRS